MGYSWSAPCDAHSVLLLFIIAPSFLALYVAALRFNDRRQRRLLVGDDKARHATLKEKSSISAGPAAEHRTTFPPSARSKADQELGPTSSTPPHWNAIPHDKNNLDPSLLRHTTCTGFTVADIQALGRFPDYSKLSGVPAPTPYDNLDISKAKPRPYRPFRWPYHQTMSLTKMEPDWWIELESTYVERIRQREELYARHGKQVLDCLPGTEMACTELMEMALQFITTRYPRLFSLSPAARPNMFHNRILSTTTDLTTTSPLEVLLHNIPEDFAIVLRDPTTGIYCLRAGIICSSLGWDLATKMGLPLAAIHAPVPDYAEKMAFSMDRFFSRMPTDKPIQRGSWGLERETPLFMPAGHPHEIHRSSQDPDLQVEDCSLRVDWQTLRRLPLTGAVVFNFKALFTPVTDFRHEPYVPALLLKVCKGAKSNIMQYKNTWHTEHVIVPALEQWAQEQVHNGTVPPEWEEGTLAESPFYSGWQEKWIKEQGFAAPA